MNVRAQLDQNRARYGFRYGLSFNHCRVSHSVYCALGPSALKRLTGCDRVTYEVAPLPRPWKKAR